MRETRLAVAGGVLGVALLIAVISVGLVTSDVIPLPFEQVAPGTAHYGNLTIRATPVLHAGPMVILSMRVVSPYDELDDMDVGNLVGASRVALVHNGSWASTPGDVYFFRTDGADAADTDYTLQVHAVIRRFRTADGYGTRRDHSTAGQWTLHLTIPRENHGMRALPAPAPVNAAGNLITFSGFLSNNVYMMGTMEASALFSTKSPRDVPTLNDQIVEMILHGPSGDRLQAAALSFPVRGPGKTQGTLKRGEIVAAWQFAGPGTYRLEVIVGRVAPISVDRLIEVA